MHNGIDIARNLSPAKAIDGADIVVVADGKVLQAKFNDSAGNMIVIDHGGADQSGRVETGYMHNSVNFVKAGQQVKQGEVIAKVGDTPGPPYSFGAHLHFYIKIDGKFVNPMDYLSKGDDEMRFNTIQEIPAELRPEIKKLVDRGILKGDGGKLDLSMDMIRILVIMQRMNSEGASK